MKKMVSLILATVMLLSLFTATSANENLQSLTVGISADFVPFEYYENEELTGFDVVLMQYMGERIGYEIQYVNLPFDKLIPAVVSGEVDCAISAISITEERKNVVDFTEPYLVAEVTYLDRDKQETKREEYGIVFPDNSIEKGNLTVAAGEPNAFALINEAIEALTSDGTIESLIDKYNLSEAADYEGYEYTYYPVPASDNDTAPWAKDYAKQAKALGITDNVTLLWAQNINREQFCELAYNMLDKAMGGYGGNTYPEAFADTDNKKVLALSALGIVAGKGDGLFDPKALLTREEAATILGRIADYAGLAHTELYYLFDDEAAIAHWAMSAVQQICNLGIMQGVGENRFSPKGAYTVEQAVATLVRMHDAIVGSAASGVAFADNMNAHMPKNQNYMFSPLSVKMALLMAANGASGETRDEILEATGVEDLDAYNEEIQKMLAKYAQSDLLRLEVANSVWLNSDKTAQRFSKDYLNKLTDVFGATADVVTNENAVSRINGWVNDKTEGKIPTIISEENKDFWAMLINAVYFKGRWLKEFNKGATAEDVFTDRNGQEAKIDFMNRTAWMGYVKTNGVEVVELPYLTLEEVFNEAGEYVETKRLEDVNVSMYLMMGDKAFSPEAVLKTAELGTEYVALSVPKFKVEYSTGLNDILMSLGIQKAFTTEAEFSDMFDSGTMWIDSTIHKTYISVDEEGTEAAAVTALGMAGSALPPEPIEVKYNKPFTFVIKDTTNGEILFMGEYAFAE